MTLLKTSMVLLFSLKEAMFVFRQSHSGTQAGLELWQFFSRLHLLNAGTTDTRHTPSCQCRKTKPMFILVLHLSENLGGRGRKSEFKGQPALLKVTLSPPLKKKKKRQNHKFQFPVVKNTPVFSISPEAELNH